MLSLYVKPDPDVKAQQKQLLWSAEHAEADVANFGHLILQASFNPLPFSCADLAGKIFDGTTAQGIDYPDSAQGASPKRQQVLNTLAQLRVFPKTVL